MNSYINPLAFRDRYAEDYYKVDSVQELLNRWPGWAEGNPGHQGQLGAGGAEVYPGAGCAGAAGGQRAACGAEPAGGECAGGGAGGV